MLCDKKSVTRDGPHDRGAAMDKWPLTLLYDGQHWLCRAEVRWLSRRNHQGRLAFDDISSASFNPQAYGVTQEEVESTFHAVFRNEMSVQGLETVRQAYQAIGLGWLVVPTGWPVLRHIFGGLYSLFARYRIPLGRLLGRKCHRETCGFLSMNERETGRRRAP